MRPSDNSPQKSIRNNEQWQLKAENPAYPDIAIHEELELVVWGLVTNVIHPV